MWGTPFHGLGSWVESKGQAGWAPASLCQAMWPAASLSATTTSLPGWIVLSNVHQVSPASLCALIRGYVTAMRTITNVLKLPIDPIPAYPTHYISYSLLLWQHFSYLLSWHSVSWAWLMWSFIIKTMSKLYFSKSIFWEWIIDLGDS